jgi:hypothetical protein
MQFPPIESRAGVDTRIKNSREDALVNGLAKIAHEAVAHGIEAGAACPVFNEAAEFGAQPLIDLNDELCVMYEKTNTYEEVVKACVLELHRLDD